MSRFVLLISLIGLHIFTSCSTGYPEFSCRVESDKYGMGPILGQNTISSTVEYAWSPDNSLILLRNETKLLHLLNLVDGNELAINNIDGRLGYGISWSPDGKWVAYSSTTITGSSRIEVAELDTGKTYQVGQAEASSWGAVWSPNSQQIAYSSDISGTVHIYITEQNNFDQSFLLVEESAWSPTWSPNGQELAFVSTMNGNEDIYTVDITSGKQIKVTDTTSCEQKPAWSPDGDEIAFISNQSGNWDLYATALHSGNPIQLTYTTTNEYQFSWSSDAEKIVYMYYEVLSSNDLRQEIAVLDLKTGTEMNITETVNSHESLPTWSLNNKSVAFLVYENQIWWVKMIDVVSGVQIRKFKISN